jgi:hypothetical protein
MDVNGFKSRKSAHDAIAAMGFKFSTLLASPESNPKVAKNGKLGVLSSPLHLAPAKLSGFNVCPMASNGCIAACLHTAGNPLYMQAKHNARIERTRAYFKARSAFMALLAFEIQALADKAKAKDMLCGIRLNATSDISFESIPVEFNGIKYRSIIDYFWQIQFYDYTKVTKRAIKWAKGELPENYHLTFSKTEANDNECVDVLKSGGTVAMVFEKKLPETYLGFPVINGDETDFRPLDPAGHIVGLKAKGKAKQDNSGFVIRGAA